MQSGQAYHIATPPVRGLVRPELAKALETAFERFARELGFTPEKPLEIQLSRGFKAGSPGHGEGRAADIAAVGRKNLLEWKQEWDQAIAAAEKLSDPQQQADAITAEQKRNLGYGLYKTLQEHGGWRVDPKGWRPYRGLMQLGRRPRGFGRRYVSKTRIAMSNSVGGPALGVPGTSGSYSCGEVGG